jgi:hypothetical protein
MDGSSQGYPSNINLKRLSASLSYEILLQEHEHSFKKNEKCSNQKIVINKEHTLFHPPKRVVHKNNLILKSLPSTK